jgi:hypothetical protein
MNREDLNWHTLHEQIVHKTVRTFKLSGKTAYVVDDSVKQRIVKKMRGISSHFDHTSGRHLMEQHVLTLGLSCEEGFVPLVRDCLLAKRQRSSCLSRLMMVAVLSPNATGQRNNVRNPRWSSPW